MSNDAKQYRKELTKPAPKKYEKRSVQTYGINDIWASDIVDYQSFAKQNKGIRFLLCNVDLYSRHAWVFPLKDKTAQSVLDCFKSMKSLPSNLWIDEGKEYLNKDFKRFASGNGINVYHTYGESKSSFVERFNRTLKTELHNLMLERNNSTYIDILEDVVEKYNNRIHSSTKQTPHDMYFKGELPDVVAVEYSALKPKYKVGDFVRISRIKKTFEKGYSHKWSMEVFEISDIDTHIHPLMYKIKDLHGESIKGKFYEPELQKTLLKDFAMVEKVLKRKTVRGVKMAFVKYDGYNDSFNEWIDAKQLSDLT